MNQMPISECYLSKFNIQPHYHRLIVYIHKVSKVFQLRRVFQIQMPISLVILVIGIQDLYTSKYKYTISHQNHNTVINFATCFVIKNIFDFARSDENFYVKIVYMAHV